MRVCRAVRGKNGPEDDEAVERDEVESSDRSDALRDSRSFIWISASFLVLALFSPPLLSSFFSHLVTTLSPLPSSLTLSSFAFSFHIIMPVLVLLSQRAKDDDPPSSSIESQKSISFPITQPISISDH